jgi:hypothetical protein
MRNGIRGFGLRYSLHFTPVIGQEISALSPRVFGLGAEARIT